MPNQTLQLTKYLDSGRNSDLFKKKIVKIRPLIAELQLSKSGPHFQKSVICNSQNMSDLDFFFF